MIEIEEFFSKLKESMESHAQELKRGDLFLSKHLKGKALTKRIFPKIADTLAIALNLDIFAEQRNILPEEYECGKCQVVDYVLQKGGVPQFFIELESLDRAQLYVFWEHEGVTETNNDNKLWYYYGTLANHYTYRKRVPRYFVWLLILPDRQVEPYQLWDVTRDYEFFHTSLKKLVCQSPYRFYDHLIKSAARLFLKKEHEFKPPGGTKWEKSGLITFQDDCELVFITCTGDRLILSRGKDLFDPHKEKSVVLNWHV